MPDRAIDPAPEAASVDRLELEGVSISDLTRDEVFSRLRDALDRRTQLCLGFCNANMLLKALGLPAYAAALRSFLLVSDGLGIDLCSGLFRGRSFRQNLNGTDLIPAFLAAETAPRTLYLLGAKPASPRRRRATWRSSIPSTGSSACGTATSPPPRPGP